MRRPLAHATATAVLSVLVAGCGGGDGDDPATSQTSDEPSEGPSEPDDEAEQAGAPCTVISDEQLTQITGSEQRVSGPRQEGTSQRCETLPESELTHVAIEIATAYAG
ncbi:hypothetical protein [Nocardioides sp. cx-173]|uniref:hypothetical protein n=1 Tax=Nocardioides sp. cx-173 TaxID=2898796 RepID=UPI001E4AF757|nr:hypothetical protein [Nocardioides sp. cx-173]MCD4523824.1 hypothetical protein [Nocardioides sp. cx-173]UGB41855.1 hypothetical protein LQ940_21215 [Nocardioides sp. cx-173]